MYCTMYIVHTDNLYIFVLQIKLNFDSLVRLENRVEMYQSLSLMYKCLGKLYSFHMSTHCTLPQKKKDGDRSKGKGRRVCLGD